MKRLVLILSALLLVPWVVAEDETRITAYLCIADMATGFVYENGRWQRTNFDVSGNKYILRQPKKSDPEPLSDSPWLWGRFGQKYLLGICDETDEYGDMECSEGGGAAELFINLSSLRYQLYYQYGYVHSADFKDTRDDTPLIEIGKCSAL